MTVCPLVSVCCTDTGGLSRIESSFKTRPVTFPEIDRLIGENPYTGGLPRDGDEAREGDGDGELELRHEPNGLA